MTNGLLIQPDKRAVDEIQNEFKPLFLNLAAIQEEIRKRLIDYADGKNLKGNELVGWLGEIYGKLLFGGTLVSDQQEHDFVTAGGKRISVKTRKGWGSGWRQTSAIPSTNGMSCPTHLLFVHLNDDYSIDRIWLFDWAELIKEGRFKKHVVRGEHRSYIILINETKDRERVVYGDNR